MAPWTRYQVAIHSYGRKRITSDCPAQGLLEWPRHHWTTISPRPLGLHAAKTLADAQPQHAVVTVWMSAEKIHDNGKAPAIPAGWYPAEDNTAT